MFFRRVRRLLPQSLVLVGYLFEPKVQPYPRCEHCGRDWHGLADDTCLAGFNVGLTTK